MIDNVQQIHLGVVEVQPHDDGPPILTLFVVETDRFGIRLCDRWGTLRSPGSPVIGKHMLVCDDDVSDENLQALVQAGYQRVMRRG